jgi:hypothetical protein
MTLCVVVGITFGEIETILKQTLLSKFQVHSSPSAFQWIWKTKVTKKLKCFVWLVFKDRINSRNLLKRKHYKVDDDDYNYVLCSLAIEEFTYHLLFQCPFSTLYWTYLNILGPLSLLLWYHCQGQSRLSAWILHRSLSYYSLGDLEAKTW